MRSGWKTSSTGLSSTEMCGWLCGGGCAASSGADAATCMAADAGLQACHLRRWWRWWVWWHRAAEALWCHASSAGRACCTATGNLACMLAATCMCLQHCCAIAHEDRASARVLHACAAVCPQSVARQQEAAAASAARVALGRLGWRAAPEGMMPGRGLRRACHDERWSAAARARGCASTASESSA